jgi:hypothetical protein
VVLGTCKVGGGELEVHAVDAAAAAGATVSCTAPADVLVAVGEQLRALRDAQSDRRVDVDGVGGVLPVGERQVPAVHGEAPRERRLRELDAQARAEVSRYVAELVANTADGHALAAEGGACGPGVGAGGGRCGKGGRVVMVDEEAGGQRAAAGGLDHLPLPVEQDPDEEVTGVGRRHGAGVALAGGVHEPPDELGRAAACHMELAHGGGASAAGEPGGDVGRHPRCAGRSAGGA